MPRSHFTIQASALAGAPLLAAARLLRDPKIRTESLLDDLLLDQPPLCQPDPRRPYWVAQAALHHRESRPS
jgi:hypothetical protein